MSRAVYGGSFDPFHNGHLALVRTLLERGVCDEVLVVPARVSPHKDSTAAPAAHRLAMTRLGLSDVPRARVLDLEIERSGPSYTVDTLEELVAADPEHEPLLLVMGDDSLAGFRSWRNTERILELAELIVFARRGSPAPDPSLAGLYRRVPDFDMPVCSTEVRAELAAGRRPEALVPAAVLDYIRVNGLYRPAEDPEGGRRG